MKFDLKSLSRKELEKLAIDVQKALSLSKERDKRDALKAAEKAVAEFGFSLNEVAAPAGNSAQAKPKKKAKKSTPSQPRFANPEDREQTWTGKGRQPFWFKKALENGVSLDAMELS